MYEFRPHSVSLTKLEFGKIQLLNQLVFQTRKELFLLINAFLGAYLDYASTCLKQVDFAFNIKVKSCLRKVLA